MSTGDQYRVLRVSDGEVLGVCALAREAKKLALNIFHQTGVRTYVVDIRNNEIFHT